MKVNTTVFCCTHCVWNFKVTNNYLPLKVGVPNFNSDPCMDIGAEVYLQTKIKINP